MPDCPDAYFAKDFCSRHYSSHRRGWDIARMVAFDARPPKPEPKPKREPKSCLVPQCEASFYGKGFCRRHYRQQRRNGWGVEAMVAFDAKPKAEPRPKRVRAPRPKTEPAAPCFLRGCGFHGRQPDPPEFGQWYLPINAGYVLRSPTAPVRICWDSDTRESLQLIADELGAPIRKVIGQKNLYRVDVEARDYLWFTLPENLQRLVAAA